MTDPGTQIEIMRERIRTSAAISDPDRDVLMDFSDELYLLQTKYSDHRHLRLLSHWTNMAEKVGGLADGRQTVTTRSDCQRIGIPTSRAIGSWFILNATRKRSIGERRKPAVAWT